MASLHRVQSGYTSFESGLKHILLLIGEEQPQGSQSHADIPRRFREARAGDRPALLVRDADFFLSGIGPAFACFPAAIDPD